MTLRKTAQWILVLDDLPLENDHSNIASKMEILFFEFRSESKYDSVEFYWNFRFNDVPNTLDRYDRKMTLEKNGTRHSVHLMFLPFINDHSNIGSKMEMLLFEFRPISTSDFVEFYWNFRFNDAPNT